MATGDGIGRGRDAVRRGRAVLGTAAERGRRALLHADELPDRVLLPAFAALGLALMLAQYAMLAFGVMEVTEFYYDAREVWRPLAENVLDGAPLYGPDQWDNKPPLWQFVSVAVAAVGPYYLVFYALTGLVHGLVAWLLFVWSRRHDAARVGLLGALLFLGSVPALYMARIDPRPFAQVFILLGLLASRPAVAGGSLAVATHFLQYSILAAPVVIWQGIRDRSRRAQVSWIARFGLAGVAVAIVTFGTVYAIWGETALRYAIRYSVLGTADYTTTHSILVVPLRTIGGPFVYATELYVILIPALIAVFGLFRDGPDWRSLRGTSLLLALALLAPYLIRPHDIYMYPPLPFMALLAAVGLREYFGAG